MSAGFKRRRREIDRARKRLLEEAQPGSARAIYAGSDGEATRAFYLRLAALGPPGLVARDVFRAMKNSERAKVYGNRKGYRDRAYEVKEWSLGILCSTLTVHGESLGITWGWRQDSALAATGDPHTMVLYIDLPTGQVSFHAQATGQSGPPYSQPWDALGRGKGPGRICDWADALLTGQTPRPPTPPNSESPAPCA